MRRVLHMFERAAVRRSPYVRSIHVPVLYPQHRPSPKVRGYVRLKAGELEREGVILRNNYSAERNAAYWDLHPVAATARLLQIGSVFGLWYLRSFLTENQAEAAAKLRNVLTSLGPAFVKIGQVASSRPDVVPPIYLKELEKLQDRIPSFPNREAFQSTSTEFLNSLRKEYQMWLVIETELKAPIQELFSSISPSPVAAASLGQVYKARLAKSDRDVAVKVQRPDVVEQLALDVYLLRKLAAFVRKWKKVNSNLPLLIDEWATSLFKEVDYQLEAANGARFKRLFGHMKGVYVPEMLLEMTTSKVLVMEWVDGIKLRTGTTIRPTSSRDGEDLRLVDVGVRCSLEQMLEEGFYHADPHPGNLMKLPNGLLCYIDFGMMGQINEQTQQALIRATLHLVNREFEALAEDFISLGMLPTGSDRTQIIPALTGVFQNAMAGGMNNLSFGDFSEKLGTTMYRYKFQIPPYYTLLVRSLTVLEGIALASDPSYKVLNAAYPWVARRLLSDTSLELRKTLKALLYKSGSFQFDRLESLLLQAVRSPGKADSFHKTNKLKGQTSSDADILTSRPLQFLLKEEGMFVRDILLDEIAKGIDAAWRMQLDDVVHATRRSVLSGMGSNPASRSPVASLWRQVLLALPIFSEDKDREQMAGLRRLAMAMQSIQRSDSGRFNKSAWHSISQASSALTWIAEEFRSLETADKEEVLKIPMVLASKLSSRVMARALRDTLGVLNQKPAREPLPPTIV